MAHNNDESTDSILSVRPTLGSKWFFSSFFYYKSSIPLGSLLSIRITIYSQRWHQ